MKKLASIALVLLLGGAAPLAAQNYSSLGLGIAAPTGDFGDFYDQGFTVRGQTGLSLLLAGAHLQAGWSRFPAKENGDVEVDDAHIYHAGAGARLGMGLFWVGANGAFFFGEGDDGVGFFPEVGLGLGPLEVVADYRIDGDTKWLGLRGGLKF